MVNAKIVSEICSVVQIYSNVRNLLANNKECNFKELLASDFNYLIDTLMEESKNMPEDEFVEDYKEALRISNFFHKVSMDDLTEKNVERMKVLISTFFTAIMSSYSLSKKYTKETSACWCQKFQDATGEVFKEACGDEDDDEDEGENSGLTFDDDENDNSQKGN